MNFGIIAAGEGSRLVQEGVAQPKPLVKIEGMPMIGRLIKIFESLGAQYICVIVNEQMTEVYQYLQSLREKTKANLDIVVKTTPSSMHSFYELGSHLNGKGRFILTTVDTIFRQEDFARYVEAYENAPADVEGMMAVTSYIDDEKPLYVQTDAEMNIETFRDAAYPGAKYISGGIYGLDSKAISVLEDCLKKGVQRMRNYQRALCEARVGLKAYDMGMILDVDHASDIEKANDFLSKKD